MAEQTKEQETDEQTQLKDTNQDYQADAQDKNGLNLVLVGGVVGASVGLLASPNIGKKVSGRISQSEMLQYAGREFRRSAQEILTEQAMYMIKQGAFSSINKYQQKFLGDAQEMNQSGINKKAENTAAEDDRYRELKEENKELGDNLQRIEDKLNKLLEAMDK